MEERADILRRKIELLRRYLREGIAAALEVEYLFAILGAEAELAKIIPDDRNDAP
jgi:hypothetical protein